MTADLLPYLLAMSVLALLFSFPILRRPGNRLAASRDQQQRRFWQQRNDEIEADFAAGLIDAELRQQLKDELDAQLVDESLGQRETQKNNDDSDTGHRGKGLSWWLSLVLLAVLPVFVVLIYEQLGAADDVVLQQQLTAWEQSPSPSLQQTQELLDALRARVEQRPESEEHRMLLAALLVR